MREGQDGWLADLFRCLNQDLQDFGICRMEETLAGQVRSYERRRALYERSREFDERIEWTV